MPNTLIKQPILSIDKFDENSLSPRSTNTLDLEMRQDVVI